MQISVDVHNYMETLVGQVLAHSKYTDQFDHEQLADLACLALSQLRPVYIRHDIDFLSALSEERLVVLKRYSVTAVEAALTMIVDDRRRNRKDEVPIMFSQPRFDDDTELEWFEKPLIMHKQDT
ncbi:late competence development ComFB family protein [Vibrio sp. Isolate25]|uniref:late competence development ComFB family protein n=1 Tax=Vibrio TaxID=662 RepID=UPI001EFE8C25|nr:MULTISPECIES: late competence development ComFB family protein [Vibrio]MCG9595742.1 late competence development ComFB family protein [Vibrio sp. Isolate25]MCG9677239.1 late competence development ComFB family protein [Vibrio sp. Isolate24]MCG9685030.1 late competence development ComFB family protein [Vibrio sp. Isolate23]USD35345.1 late competence development ComFB family protein [Vibrio sp. SCSIO 43186]USD48411.1 late competence development ComFB family protein [Vibrio sp. SCSIO 43145]